jgi:carboxylesterase
VPVLPGAEPFAPDGGDVGVLLCHGFTGTPQSLQPWARRLADEGLSVRLPLLPGHGTTWQEMNTTTWADWYDAAERSLDELTSRCRAVVVGGLSMGGALAARLAAERGADVRGLALVNPAFVSDDPRMRALPLIKHLVPSLPGIGSDIAKAGSTELAYDRTPLKALHSFVRSWTDTVRALPAITQPLLVMHSRVDHVVPPRSSALLISRVSSKDVTEVVLENSYHVATLDEDADLIEKTTLEFVARVTA